MPIYGYACKICDHTLDVLQKIADDPLVDCPACGEPGLKRQLSAPRFRLKGRGWYETDFKSDKQRNLAGDKDPSKPDKKPKDQESESKLESKPDSKSESAPSQKAKPKSKNNDASSA
jgi:putative FmdB family regulatory protein